MANARALSDARDEAGREHLTETLDTLMDSLSNVDVISVVGADGRRLYHSNHALIGTAYDGTLPDFSGEQRYYAFDDNDPSGRQRRAYAAVYDGEGNCVGFVIAVMLRENIRRELLQLLGTFALIAAVAVLVELSVSYRLSRRIKESLMGFEPDVFSAMYRIRDNILESLDEGVVAVDAAGEIQFLNQTAAKLLGTEERAAAAERGRALLGATLKSGEKETGVPERGAEGADLLIDRIPIRKGQSVVGAVGILHDRTEYTLLAEDLSGTRFLVDSMRANNHDFTNKLHVILGLLQMELYDQAKAYIENITIVQREGISKIIRAVDEPSVAALLIGKTARASELNVNFRLREGSGYRRDDLPLPAETLVTVIGNLIDNALDAMNGAGGAEPGEKELLFGIYSRPGALLITVDDTGAGISANNLEHIFENGFTTKGAGHGTGLYQVKKLVEGLGGAITAESQEGVGTSFSVSFHREETDGNV